MTKDKIISLAIICGTIMIAAFIMMNMDFYIQDASNNQLPNNLVTNTISVQGDGKVFATPDMLILNLSVEETRATTEEAQAEVNKKVQQIKDIIKKHKIKDSNVQTQNVNVYPEYDYKETGRDLLGYRARHSLEIKIKNANLENDGIGGQIIDDVSKIGKVVVNNISYDIEDKTPYYTQARELAMDKASQKAKELAKIGKVTLLKPISISENLNTQYPQPMFRNTYATDMGMDEAGSSAEISLGELEVNITLSVIYGIE